jgi:hypothetical protein
MYFFFYHLYYIFWKENFSEQNGFWVAKRPSDYVKIIKPTDCTTTIAIRTRASLLFPQESLLWT